MLDTLDTLVDIMSTLIVAGSGTTDVNVTRKGPLWPESVSSKKRARPSFGMTTAQDIRDLFV